MYYIFKAIFPLKYDDSFDLSLALHFKIDYPFRSFYPEVEISCLTSRSMPFWFTELAKQLHCDKGLGIEETAAPESFFFAGDIGTCEHAITTNSLHEATTLT